MEHNLFDLTIPQKSILLIEQYFSNTNINNICGILNISKSIDVDLLEKTINYFVQHNDSYRIKIHLKNNKFMQYIDDFKHFNITKHYVKHMSEVEELRKNLNSIPFVLLDSTLYEFHIFQFPNKFGGFLIKVHHLISDSWSLGITGNKIIEIYSHFIQSTSLENNKTFSYIDFIKKDSFYLESDKYIKDKLFWSEQFLTIPEIASIPFVKNNIAKKETYNANRKTFIIEKNFVNKIKTYCKKNNISIFCFYLCVLSIYINKISNLSDFVIGSPLLNRTSFNDKNTTGMFINVLPIRINMSDSLNFTDFVHKVSEKFISILRHQKYSYQQIINDLREKDSSIHTLYKIMLSYQITNTSLDNSFLPHTTDWFFNNIISNDMEIHLLDLNDLGELTVSYDYRTEKYYEKDIKFLHNRLLYIIEQIIQIDKINIENINIIPPEEKKLLLRDFNNTYLQYPKEKTITYLFEQKAKEVPDKIALIFGNSKLTYKQLNDKANQLANFLKKEKQIKNNSFIGLMVNRSLEMFIGILAIIKAGCAYIPIDPEYPKERIIYMIEDSNCNILLTDTSNYNKITSIENIDINLSSKIYVNHSTKNLNLLTSPQDIIYLIYTSGSTGKPKGVLLTHQNINNYIHGLSQKIDFSDGKIIVSVTTICFDIFVTESWASLINGLTIVIANENEQNIPYKLNSLCLKNNVNMIQTTPSRFQLLLESNHIEFFYNLSDVMVGGESLPKRLLKKLKKFNNINIYNMYGPTETAVWSTIKYNPSENNISIGNPIANTQIYILDEKNNLLPINIPGRLFIGRRRCF